MKRRNALMMALAVLLAVPAQLVAQGGGGMGGRGMGGGMGGFGMARALVEQGSVDFLLTKAADLQLTADQATKLQAVAAKWAEGTKDSRAALKESLPQPGQAMGGDREAAMQRMQAARPHIEKVVTEDASAVESAMALLTDAQKPQAQKLLEERRASLMPRRGGGGG